MSLAKFEPFIIYALHCYTYTNSYFLPKKVSRIYSNLNRSCLNWTEQEKYITCNAWNRQWILASHHTNLNYISLAKKCYIKDGRIKVCWVSLLIILVVFFFTTVLGIHIFVLRAAMFCDLGWNYYFKLFGSTDVTQGAGDIYMERHLKIWILDVFLISDRVNATVICKSIMQF